MTYRLSSYPQKFVLLFVQLLTKNRCYQHQHHKPPDHIMNTLISVSISIMNILIRLLVWIGALWPSASDLVDIWISIDTGPALPIACLGDDCLKDSEDGDIVKIIVKSMK